MQFNYKEIHIGELIKDRITELEMASERIVDFLQIDELELELLYSAKSLDSVMLLKCCKLLEYDFFRIYSHHLTLYTSAGNNNPKSVNGKLKSSLPSFKKSLYTPEIIEFIIEIIGSGEKSAAEVIKEYRIPKTTLHRWLRKHQKIDI